MSDYLELPLDIGQDVRVAKDVIFTQSHQVHLGNHVSIDSGFYCTTALMIGDYVHISPHVAVIGGSKGRLEIGDFCFISVGANIVCASEEFHGRGLVGPCIPTKYKDKIIIAPVCFEPFSGILASSVVGPGVTLGMGSILGANSYLKEDTAPWTIYVGSPARPIKRRESVNCIRYAKAMGYEYVV